MNEIRLPTVDKSNGWNEWSRFVLSELKRLSQEVSDLRKEVSSGHSQTQVAIASLQAKSGLVGFLGGLVPAIAVLIYFLVAQ